MLFSSFILPNRLLISCLRANSRALKRIQTHLGSAAGVLGWSPPPPPPPTTIATIPETPPKLSPNCPYQLQLSTLHSKHFRVIVHCRQHFYTVLGFGEVVFGSKHRDRDHQNYLVEMYLCVNF